MIKTHCYHTLEDVTQMECYLRRHRNYDKNNLTCIFAYGDHEGLLIPNPFGFHPPQYSLPDKQLIKHNPDQYIHQILNMTEQMMLTLKKQGN